MDHAVKFLYSLNIEYAFFTLWQSVGNTVNKHDRQARVRFDWIWHDKSSQGQN